MLLILVTILLSSISVTAFLQEKDKLPIRKPYKEKHFYPDEELEKIQFIHYKENKAKVPKQNTCYKLLGVKWKTFPIDYVINPSNPQGLSDLFVTSMISASAETWDSATSIELFNDIYDINTTAKYGVQNFENVIVFGDYPDSGVIGITSIWYTRFTRQIVEFDMLLNTDFIWGDATLNPSVMDLKNIVVHELGHSVGLGDIYSSSCSAVTMFGYSDYGETSKQTLETPDITGLQKMYGV